MNRAARRGLTEHDKKERMEGEGKKVRTFCNEAVGVRAVIWQHAVL